MIIKRVTTTRSVIGTAFADVTDMVFPVGANGTYVCRFVPHITTNATTTGARFSLNGPASPTGLRYGGGIPSAVGTAAFGSQTAYDTAIFATTAGTGATGRMAWIEGLIRNGANDGSLALRFASEVVSPGQVNVLEGSSGYLYTASDFAQLAVVTATRSVVGTAFADVTDMALPMAANTNYIFHFCLHFTTNASTTGARFAINGPASPNSFRAGILQPTTTAAANFGSVTAYNTAIRAATTGSVTAVMAVIDGVFRNGANSGNLQLRFAAEVVSPGQVDVLADSFGYLLAA